MTTTPPFDPDPLIEDFTAALDKHTAGAPVHPDGLDELAEWAVGWFEQRGYLPVTGATPVLYLLTDRTNFLGLHESLSDAQMRPAPSSPAAAEPQPPETRGRSRRH